MSCFRRPLMVRVWWKHRPLAPATRAPPPMLGSRTLSLTKAPALQGRGGVGVEVRTAATAAATPGAGAADGQKVASEQTAAKRRPAETEGVFSKHGGKMVLGFIGGIGLWFLRSHLGGKALDALKNEVEEECPLEPVEVEELRGSNDFPPIVFEEVLESVRRAFPSGRTTYPEFVRHVTSSGLLPEPLSMGFLLDRMALTAAAHSGFLGAAARGEVSLANGASLGEGQEDLWSKSDACTVELEVDFLMVAFSAAVNTTPAERIRQLWNMARDEPSQGAGDDQHEDEAHIPASRAISIVGMLMASHQLPSGRYAVKDEQRVWPVQQYRLASGRDAFYKGLVSLHEDEEKRTKGWIERKLAPAYDPAKEENVSLELFERVLRSGPVCAWGECLGRRDINSKI